MAAMLAVAAISFYAYSTNHRLANSISLQQATLESTTEAILAVDLNNNWVLHNQQFVDLWHITDEIIATKDDRAALSYMKDQLENAEGFLSRVREIYATPEVNSLDTIKLKDGRRVERSSIPQYAYGKVVGRVWSFRDITENMRVVEILKERAEQLTESESRFRRLADATFEGIIIHDNGVALDVNEKYLKITGYSREDIIGQNVIELLFAPEFKAVAYEKVRSGNEDAYDALITRKDGSLILIELKGRNIDTHGKRLRVAVIRDISEQKNAEKNLREAKDKAERATRLKDQFIALISHDLRSPLLSIKGILDIAKDETPDGLLEMSKNHTFDRIAKSAEGLIVLTERLLDHSRLQTGDIKPEMMFINVWSLAEDRISRISHLASIKKITIRNFLPEAMHIYADPDLYGEVIHNVLSNAIKFTHQGGEITILSTDEPSVIVRDNGIGVDEKMLPDLFNIEVKTTSYGTDGEKGTGLGLPYSYNIMKTHGGNLMAMPTKGQGAEFHIILPKHTTFVLVVDDQDIQRAIMKEMITRLDRVQVVEARNGAEALDMLRYIKPAIIITDIQMPVLDGFELVRWLRNLPEYEMVPIMAVTSFAGYDSQELREKLSTLGADDIIAKPLAEDEFLPVVARYLGLS